MLVSADFVLLVELAVGRTCAGFPVERLFSSMKAMTLVEVMTPVKLTALMLMRLR